MNQGRRSTTSQTDSIEHANPHERGFIAGQIKLLQLDLSGTTSEESLHTEPSTGGKEAAHGSTSNIWTRHTL